MRHRRDRATGLVVALGRAAAVGAALLATVFLLGAPSPALAQDPGCVALGGTDTGTECQLNVTVSRTGPFTIGIPLHILGAGRINTGAGGITLDITGGFVMEAGALIDGNAAGAGSIGGPITITVHDGDIDLKPGSTIRSNAVSGGAINITADPPGTVNIDGLVESVGSASGTTARRPGGGPIFIKAGCELTVSDDGVVSSRGLDPGADLVHLEGCVVLIQGLVESTGRGHVVPDNPPNSCSDVAPRPGSPPRRNPTTRPGKPQESTGCVEIWSGTTLIIQSTEGHRGEVNADIGGGGPEGRGWIDLFARGTVSILDGTGNDRDDNPLGFAVHANSVSISDETPGLINIRSLAADVVASGNAIQADVRGGVGGEIHVEAFNNIDLDGATIFARGDSTPNGPGTRSGGQIGTDATHGVQPNEPIRAFNGAIVWRDGVGDVRPTGTAVTVAARRGIIIFQDCQVGPVDTTGTTFPTTQNSTATTPTNLTDACGGAPVLPAYVTGDLFNTFPAENCLAQCVGPCTKSGMKFNDLNNNGVNDGEPGLPGWEIRAYTFPGNVFAGNATTDTNGNYAFTTLACGTYTFCEVLQQPNWTQTFPNTLGGDVVSCVGIDPPANLGPFGYRETLVENEPEVGNDFGNFFFEPPDGECPEDPLRASLITRTVNLSLPATGTNYHTVQAAYDAVVNPNEVIGLFLQATDPEGTGGTIENILLDRPIGNVTITQCTVARVTADDGSLPVWTIGPNAGHLLIIGPDAIGGSEGWLIEGNGHELRGIRATGAGIGLRITGNSNSVSWNSMNNNGQGVKVEGDANDLRGGTVSQNTSGGVLFTATANNNIFRGATVQENGGQGILADGILVEGSNNTVRDNRVNLNTGHGIHVTGNENLLRSNRSEANGQDGFNVFGSQNRLRDNTANNNTGNEFTIGPNNISGGGNKANGVLCPFGAAGTICN